MHQYTGILLAFSALICWGFGDFFIQKTTKAVGSWKALFFIGIVGLFGIFPFIIKGLSSLSIANILLLCLVSIIIIFAALFDFEALRQGKIAIIEPVMGLELPLTVGLSIVLAKESLSVIQI
ncbi:EamA family transporter, partial [Patescibacteria group bacterium]|nr:EamA family transporter [Patescibacteria group bacterium]